MNILSAMLSTSVAAVSLLAGFPAQAVQAGPAGAGPDAAQPRTAWAERRTGYLAVADGTRLRYSVLLPSGKGPFPVVLNFNGYDAGVIGGSEYRAGRTAMSAELDATLLENGYAVMGLNVRGTGCSSGDFELFDPRWGGDGATAVEWAAAQPWSNGAVGMANWSFSGLSQLATAIERPPHLKAIAPGMVVVDLVRDVSAPGGVLNHDFPARWWVSTLGFWQQSMRSAEQERDEECLRNTVRNLVVSQRGAPPLVQALHRRVDEWASLHTLDGRTGAIDIPVLSIEAWQDELTGVRGGNYLPTLDPAKTWYVGINGAHNMYPNHHVRRILLAFFDRFLKGLDNGFERGPRATLLMEATADALTRAGYDAAEPGFTLRYPQAALPVRPLAFSFAAGGRLTEGAEAEAGVDRFAYPVAGPTANVGREGWGPQSSGWESGSLHYTTAPFAQPMLFAGGASVDLWVSSDDAVDAELQATLTEVRPDGQEQYVQRGWLRLSDRALDEARSTPLVPVHLRSNEAVRPMLPLGEPVAARIEIPRFAHAFRAGSRLRVWIEAPSATGGFGFREPRFPASLGVHRGDGRASGIVLGALPPSAPLPAMPAACGRVVLQPCRPDPLAER